MISPEINMLSLFSGIAGLDRAAHQFGIKTVAFVEFDPFCQAILKLRYPGVPVYGDIRQVTGKQLERDGITRIDIVAGGFPCQGNSTAGKRKGKADERYLWPEMARIVREVNSTWMVAENVRGIFSVDGGELFGDVLRDVADMGHSVGWGCWGANAVGAPHKRERAFIMAHSDSHGRIYRQDEEFPDQGRQYAFRHPSPSSQLGLNWPTPRANDAEKRGNIADDPRNGLPAAVLWPTPQARDYKSGDSPGCGRQQRKAEQGWSLNLNDAVKMWPTPNAHDNRDRGNLSNPCIQKREDSGKQIDLSMVVSDKSGQLNPDWVECLMNFPIGWTDPNCINPTPWPGWPSYRGQQQYDYEPPRIVSGMKNRPKRLKALGNAVVPLQAVPIFRAITQIINYHKGGASQ